MINQYTTNKSMILIDRTKYHTCTLFLCQFVAHAKLPSDRMRKSINLMYKPKYTSQCAMKN